jgi:zinc protease
LCRDGLSAEAFEQSRGFLSKYVNVLTKTKRAELGYAIDSLYYRIPNYNDYLKTALAKLTLEDVNRAIKAHLRTSRLVIAVVSRDGEGLKRQLASDDVSPMTYNSAKPASITEEDKIVEKWPLNLRAADITVKPVAEIFQ